jgi:hypothetical protein
MKKWLASLSMFVMIFSFALPGISNAADAPVFKDVGGTFWAKDAINSMAQLGVLGGYNDHTFKPNAPVTREEFATLITKSFFLDLPSADAAQTFADVSNSRWSFAAVEASKEFLTGYYPPSGKAFFDPTANATREDVAVALVKTLHYQPDDLQDPNILDRYNDYDSVSPNVSTYVALAVEKKLIAGYNDGTIKPDQPVTRAEAASLLYRVIKGASSDSQQGLTLNVDAPATTSTPTFYVTGDVTKGAKVYINDKEVEVVQGQFRVGYQLDQEGTFTYTISARIPGGKTQTVTKTIKFEKGAPVLDVKGVPDTTDKKTIDVSWTVKDDNDPNPVVYVNDERQSYSSSISIDLAEGDNIIKVRAENSFGKSTEIVKHVVFQTGGPVLTVQDVPATVNKQTLTVSWTVQDKNDSSPKVYVNDQLAYYGSSADVTLKDGTNTITIKAVNNLGKSTVVTKTVVFNGGGPQLTVDPLPDSTDKSSITVSWHVQDNNDSSPKVYVNGTYAYYGSSTSVDLTQGPNVITIRAVNSLGKTTEVTKTVNFVSGGPVLKVDSIPTSTSNNNLTVSWNVTDKNDSSPKVYVNGTYAYYGNSSNITLTPGLNTIKIKAVNSLGQTTEESHDITFDPPAPKLTLGYAPETTASSSITLTWTVSDDNDSSPKVFINDELISYGSMKNLSLNEGVNTFKIVASNSFGKTTTVNYTVTYTTTPPAPPAPSAP